MKRLLFSIGLAVFIYVAARVGLLLVPNTNIFDDPFGFYGIIVAVVAIAFGVWFYWGLDPNRLARARDRRNRQR